jgi:CTP synthase (UTP-ammonia lyase)
VSAVAKPKIAVVGDYDPGNRTHLMTDEALGHVGCAHDWIPTEDCAAGAAGERLAGFGGVFIAPASPYRSMDGALDAIRLARERDVPLVGT